MAYTLLSALLLVSLLSTVEAADGDHNAACGASNACTGTGTANDVCDTKRPTSLCKTKATGTCTVNDDCVAGSSCSNSPLKCQACDSTSSDAAGDLCTPKTGYIGATCGSCTTPNSECSATTTKCVCKTGYTTVYSTFSCLASLGTTCSADADCYDGSTNNVCDTAANVCRIKLTKSCVGSADKCVTKASCTGNSATTCACNTGYTVDGTICKAGLGTTCSADADCADSGNSGNNVCDLVAKVCRIKPTKTCTGNLDKCVTGAACTAASNTQCECGSTYSVDGTTSCKPKLGTACTPTAAVSCDGSDNICDPYSNTCKIGSARTCVATETKCTTGATCTTSGSTTCVCDTVTTVAEASKLFCQKKIAIGAACTWYDKCTDADAVCDLQLGKCAKKESTTCSASDTCVSGSTCDSATTKCKCSTGFTATSGLCVAANGKAGGACSSGACTDTNAECKTTPAYGGSANTACYCKANSQFNPTDGTCKALSGASSLSKMTGLFTVMVALYLGFQL